MNGTMETIRCPMCATDSYVPLFRWKQEGTAIVRCCECGLLYVNPRKYVQEIESYFRDEYIHADQQIFDVYDVSRSKSLGDIADMVMKVGKGGKILDIGCAAGKFLSFFADKKNWSLHGLEISQFASEKAKLVSDVTVYNVDLYEAGFHDKAFDVITMLDALYFVPDPLAILKEINRILDDDGLLVVELPGFVRMLWKTGPISIILHGRWNSITPHGHLFFFSRKSFSTMLEKAGFYVERVEMQYFPSRPSKLIEWLNSFYLTVAKIVYKLSMHTLCISGRVVYFARK